MFHNLLLWCLWTFAIWIYTFRPRWPTTVAAIGLAILLLPPLQEAKWQLRADTVDQSDDLEEFAEPAFSDKTVRWLAFLAPSLQETLTLRVPEEFLAEMAVRYNQGWIVNRVMQWVPENEPFARGATLISAAEASLLPRVISPEKARSGGKENMERFAGLELNENTSMNLGYVGEMYANFGVVGGIIGCGIYTLFFGLLFRLICRRAVTNPLWWSFVPFLFFSAVKAEDDIAYVMNWLVKGGLVLAAVVMVMPNLRRALLGSIHAPAQTDRAPMTALR